MKITKSELKQIIREEAIRFKKKIQLEQELASIQSQLDEVHAGGDMDSSKSDGVHAGQKKAEFTTKNQNGGFGALVEDDVEMEMNEMVDENMEESYLGEEDDIDISEIFAEMEMEEGLYENLEEPIEGESPAQDANHWANDGMEKDNHVNEEEEVEVEETDNNMISESVKVEKSRMQQLAGIKKPI
jgi:hypothetical protein